VGAGGATSEAAAALAAAGCAGEVNSADTAAERAGELAGGSDCSVSERSRGAANRLSD
jgi:hypothetical protein